MSPGELVTYLEELNRTAVGYLSDEVSIDQDDNLDRYLGKPYGDEEEGLSTAMSMDVAEVIDWALPDLLEPFLAGDRVVEFEPSTTEDEAWTEQASDLANHVFYSDNAGVIVLHDTIKTGLIQKIGWTKTWWEDEEKLEQHTVSGLSIMNIEELQADQSVTIEEQTAEPIGEMLDESIAAAFADGMTYTVKFSRKVKSGCLKIESVPPEEVKVSQRARDIQSVRYICHETEATRSDLIEMGFDQDVVMSVKAERRVESDRRDTRFPDEQREEYSATAKLNDLVTLIEEYPLLDVNGDGRAERMQVFRVGKTILAKDEVSEHPFDCWTADRIPHRLIGLALADKVKQTQKIKTHLTRDLLNNIYMANRPRMEVPDQAVGDNTIDDLLNIRIGGLIRTKQPAMLRSIEVPDRSANALQAITYMDGVREQQSGITRNGMAASAEMVDPKSAQESARQQRNEQVRKRLMCRMIAETFLVPVFRKILKNIVRYQDAPRTLKLRGKWVTMDPRSWNADLKARAAVGLGHSNRDEELLAAQTVGQAQALVQPLGLVSPKHMYKTASQIIKAVGWRDADEYFVDPDSEEGRQALAAHAQSQGQDPRMAEAQAKMQLDQAKAQHDAQMRSAELTHKAQMAEMQAEMDRQIAQLKADNEFKIAQLRIAAEQQIAMQRTNAEIDLAEWKTGKEMELAEKKLRMQPQKASGSGNGVSNGSSQRFGGSVAS